MRAYLFICSCLVAALLFARPNEALAQARNSDPQALQQEIDQLKNDFEQLKQQYGSRLSALEARMSAMQSGSAAPQSLVLTSLPAGGVRTPTPVSQPPAPQVPATPETSVAPQTQGVAGSSVGGGGNVFNPDISVIGNFLGIGGSNKVSPDPALEMKESEVSVQAIVDPYARADFFISFGEEGVDLEEGYLTFPTIPGGLLLKVGKMRAAFGKVNGLHSHVLSWADRPILTKNLLGGEDGINDAGFSVAKIIPNPLFFLEATGQVFRGDSADLFRSSQRSDLSYVGHLRGYQDISDSTNIDLGASFSEGHNSSGLVGDVDLGRFRTKLYGADATLRWKPLQRSVYHSFIGRSEFVWSQRNQPGGMQKGAGFFVSGDYQVGRRWFTGARYDWSSHADDAALKDKGQSLLLTYKPSEFSLVRGQFRRTQYAVGKTANEFLMQFMFAIGAHGAHPF